MFRKIVFWAHLVVGLVAGVFVLLMSVTGVVLTYERQIVDYAISRAVDAPAGAVPLGPDEMVSTVLANGVQPGLSLVLSREATAPAALVEGRNGVPLDPFTGVELVGAGEATETFFSGVTSLHRWLSTSGRNDVGAALTGASNLLFLFLVISGLYLWLPPLLRWVHFKTRLFFRRAPPSAQARRYNWHHVFGIWALIPLFFIVLSGVVMSYSWANNLVFVAAGEEAPQGRPRRAPLAPPEGREGETLTGAAMSYEALLEAAGRATPGWNRASITLPRTEDAFLNVVMDEGNGAQPSAQTQLLLDRMTGEVVSARTGGDATLGVRLRGWFRFVHTGEVYGVAGQTIAGLASIAAVFLVYTGAMLGVRRLSRMRPRRTA